MNVAVAETVGSLRRRLAARLESAFGAAGRDGTPALDARLILAHALGLEASRLPLVDGEPVAPALEARAEELVARRVAGEPIARLVGRREFWGLEFEVGAETLVPRPDTETLVEAALGFARRARPAGEAPSLLDLGTGTGAILLALLSELPGARGTGTDIAEATLDVARGNARRLGLAGRAGFVACDWTEGLAGRFDLILSNPPYIETDAIDGLAIEVRRHEPRRALDGGPDGLAAHRRIVAGAGRLLAPGGRLFLEIGHTQAAAMRDLAGKAGFSAVVHRDLAGRDRVVELAALMDG